MHTAPIVNKPELPWFKKTKSNPELPAARVPMTRRPLTPDLISPAKSVLLGLVARMPVARAGAMMMCKVSAAATKARPARGILNGPNDPRKRAHVIPTNMKAAAKTVAIAALTKVLTDALALSGWPD